MNKQLRVCTVCGGEKPANRLFFHLTGHGRYRGDCSQCWRFYNAANHANNRAKLLGHAERLTVADIRAAYAQAAGCCYYTQAPHGEKWVIDHIMPLSRGGLNTPNNICVTTARINSMKGDMLPEQFAAKLASMGIVHELQEGLELPIQQRLRLED